MRKWLVVVATVLLSVACQGQRPVPVDPTVPAAPAASAAIATPGEPRPNPAGSRDARWWCAFRVDGMPANCYRELAECQADRAAKLKRGRETKDCVSQATAFCFTATSSRGFPPLSCGATLSSCRLGRDFVVINPDVAVATSECTEQPSGAASSAETGPAWWCAAGIGKSVCQRERVLCEQFREVLTQTGQQVTDCSPEASAYCFTNKAPDGMGVLDCAATSAACRSWHDDPSRATPMTECEETR